MQNQDQQSTTGAPAYDAGGAKAGTLHASNPQHGYLMVRTGGLFRRTDLYIPLTAVSRSDAAGVSLQLSKADLTAAHYDCPWPRIDHPIATGPPISTTPPAGGATGAAAAGPSVATTETMTTRAPAPSSPAPAARFSALDG